MSLSFCLLVISTSDMKNNPRHLQRCLHATPSFWSRPVLASLKDSSFFHSNRSIIHSLRTSENQWSSHCKPYSPKRNFLWFPRLLASSVSPYLLTMNIFNLPTWYLCQLRYFHCKQQKLILAKFAKKGTHWNMLAQRVREGWTSRLWKDRCQAVLRSSTVETFRAFRALSPDASTITSHRWQSNPQDVSLIGRAQATHPTLWSGDTKKTHSCRESLCPRFICLLHNLYVCMKQKPRLKSDSQANASMLF